MNAFLQDKGSKWLRNRWDGNNQGRKLYKIDPKVGGKMYHTIRSRLDEIKSNRIRIANNRFTQKHLAAGEDVPEYIIGRCVITVEHIFMDCPLYAKAWNQFFGTTKFQQIMHRKSKTKCYDVIKFLKYSNI